MTPFRTLSGLLGRAGLSFDGATLRDASRLALQSGAASVAAYLALRAIGSEELFVGILSAVMILQPSIGGTMQSARARLSASVLGSAIGLACLFALPAGYGTAIGLLMTMFVLNGLAVLRPAWSYGIVAAVALSISSDDLVQASIDRLLAIGIGGALGLIVAAILWPDTAGARFERHMASALRTLRSAFGDVLDKAGCDDPGDAIAGRRELNGSLADADTACAAMHMADMGPRRERMTHVRAILDSIWLLDAVLERTGDLSAKGLGDPISGFRETGARVLEGLAEDDVPVDALADLDAAFGALRDALQEVHLPDPRDCDQAQVIVFAAGSIRDRLGDLVRALRDRPEPSPGWAARVRTTRG